MVQLKRKKKIVVNVETQGYPIERHHFLTTQRVYWRHMRTLQKTLFLNLKKKTQKECSTTRKATYSHESCTSDLLHDYAYTWFL